MRIEKTQTPEFLTTLFIQQISFPNFKSRGRIFFLIVASSLLLFSMQSCKDPGLTDIDLQPAQDKLGVNYTSVSQATSATLKNFKTETRNGYINMLGSVKDPVFGKSEAGFATQFVLSKLSPNFYWNDTVAGVPVKKAPIIDSVILSFVYADFYDHTSIKHAVL